MNRIPAVIDAHAHPRELEDIGAAVDRAKEAGVAGIVSVGMEMADVRAAPPENILLETDGPVAFGGVASELRDALNTLREVVRLKILEADVVARQATMNALALYGIGKHLSAEGLKG